MRLGVCLNSTVNLSYCSLLSDGGTGISLDKIKHFWMRRNPASTYLCVLKLLSPPISLSHVGYRNGQDCG